MRASKNSASSCLHEFTNFRDTFFAGAVFTHLFAIGCYLSGFQRATQVRIPGDKNQVEQEGQEPQYYTFAHASDARHQLQLARLARHRVCDIRIQRIETADSVQQGIRRGPLPA